MHFLSVCQGFEAKFDPDKLRFSVFARGDWGVHDPGKLRFLTFARGSARNLTLANRVFRLLPVVRCEIRPWLIAFFGLCQGFSAKFNPGKDTFLPFTRVAAQISPWQSRFSSTVHGHILVLHNRAAIAIPSGAPPQPRRHRHSQRRSASTAPPSPFPAALRLNRAAIPIPSGAPPQLRRTSQRIELAASLCVACKSIPVVKMALQNTTG